MPEREPEQQQEDDAQGRGEDASWRPCDLEETGGAPLSIASSSEGKLTVEPGAFQTYARLQAKIFVAKVSHGIDGSAENHIEGAESLDASCIDRQIAQRQANDRVHWWIQHCVTVLTPRGFEEGDHLDHLPGAAPQTFTKKNDGRLRDWKSITSSSAAEEGPNSSVGKQLLLHTPRGSAKGSEGHDFTCLLLLLVAPLEAEGDAVGNALVGRVDQQGCLGPSSPSSSPTVTAPLDLGREVRSFANLLIIVLP
jgi:hypothetical protein